MKWLLGGGVGAVLLLILVCLGVALQFKHQEESTWQLAQTRIQAEVTDPQQRAILLAIAETQHRRALHAAAPEDLAGRKHGLATSDEAYYTTLMQLCADCLQDFSAKEKPTVALLNQTWERWDLEHDVIIYYRLHPDGHYRCVYGSAGSDHTLLKANGGAWKLEAATITFNPGTKPDVNPVVLFCPTAFVLREMDGQMTYWIQSNPPAAFHRELSQ